MNNEKVGLAIMSAISTIQRLRGEVKMHLATIAQLEEIIKGYQAEATQEWAKQAKEEGNQ